MKILVTGGTGLIGKHLQPILDATYLSSKDGDLRNLPDTINLFVKHQPEVVIHLAATVDGIKENTHRNYKFYLDNVLINTNVIDIAKRFNVKYIIAASSTCVYGEGRDLEPYYVDKLVPHFSNSGYAYAKRAMRHHLLVSQIPYSLIYFGNLYGKGDRSNHCIPEIIRKISIGDNNFYGTGNELRQFVYAKDAASIIRDTIENYKYLETQEFNFCNTEISIKNVIDTVSRLMNKSINPIFNNQYCGVKEKQANGISYNYTPLKVGLAETIKEI